MPDIAIAFSTSRGYVDQALAMCRQLARFGQLDRAWVVPLEPLDDDARYALASFVGDRLTPVLALPENVKASGNKPYLPEMLPPHAHYLLIDTDIIILSSAFFDRFGPDARGRTTLVRESFSCAHYLAQIPTEAFRFTDYPEILERPYLQTGVIGVSRDGLRRHVSRVRAAMERSTVTSGDLQAWNHVAWQDPGGFVLRPPRDCLVLRPTGKGASSIRHLEEVQRLGDRLLHDGAPVNALHYTSSRGAVATVEDYAGLVGVFRPRLPSEAR